MPAAATTAAAFARAIRTGSPPRIARSGPWSANTAPRIESTPTVEIYMELQAVEDLLTGNESEKREGLDKLHQLVRRLRPAR